MSFKSDTDDKIVLAVPSGAEGAARVIANKELGINLVRLDDGLCLVKKAQPNSLESILQFPPRWSFGAFLKLDAPITKVDDGDDEAAVAALLESVKRVVSDRSLINSRFRVTEREKNSRMTKKLRDRLVTAENLGIINDPSNYNLSLEVGELDSTLFVLLGTSFSVRMRFSYRVFDLPASINPVLAALLVRLTPQFENGVALDVTTGSGTLLFERLLYSPTEVGTGIDIDSDAERAFSTNLQSPVLFDIKNRAAFTRMDARKKESWKEFDFAVSNPPFGMRLKVQQAELIDLYNQLVSNAALFMKPNGRFIIVTTHKSGIESSIQNYGRCLKILAHYKIWSGGLVYQTYVLGRK